MKDLFYLWTLQNLFSYFGLNHSSSPPPGSPTTRFLFYKQKIYKHSQPQIWEILSTLLSTPPASDFEIANKIQR